MNRTEEEIAALVWHRGLRTRGNRLVREEAMELAEELVRTTILCWSWEQWMMLTEPFRSKERSAARSYIVG